MDFRISPISGDYDRTSVSDLSNAIYLRVTVPLGSYWADVTLGSKLHLLRRAKDLSRNTTLAIQYTREALQPLLDDKRAERIDVDAQWSHDGRLELSVQAWQHGLTAGAFKHYVKVA